MTDLDLLGAILIPWLLVGLPLMLWLTHKWAYGDKVRALFTFLSLLLPVVGWVILLAVLLHGVTTSARSRSVSETV